MATTHVWMAALVGLTVGVAVILLFSFLSAGVDTSMAIFTPTSTRSSMPGNITINPGVEILTAVKTNHYTFQQVIDIEHKVCARALLNPRYVKEGDESFMGFAPKQVNFTYLQPINKPVMKIACGLGPPGYSYGYFVLSDNGTVLPRSSFGTDLFHDISDSRQALEYLEQFYVNGPGRYPITNQSSYAKLIATCDVLQEPSSKIPTVTEATDHNSYKIEILVRDMNTPDLILETWNVYKSFSPVETTSLVPVANCHTVI